MRLKLGFLASHNGSNMQAIIDACNKKILDASCNVIISNNSDSGALKRAIKENIPGYHISSLKYPDENELDIAILNALKKHEVNLVILAGYMKKIGPFTLDYYKGRILNIHPALLPKYGGEGMYGKLVHEAVLKAKEKITGVTVHLVDKDYDKGPILNQIEVPVKENDNADILAERVLKAEHEIYVKTLKLISENKIKLNNL